MHVFAVGKCASSAGRILTVGIGWKPSSDAGSAGDPVQKFSCDKGDQAIGKELTLNTLNNTHQVLFLETRHLLDGPPQPPFELDQLVALFVRLVIEGRVGDQGAHVDVSDTVQQQTQILCR